MTALFLVPEVMRRGDGRSVRACALLIPIGFPLLLAFVSTSFQYHGLAFRMVETFWKV